MANGAEIAVSVTAAAVALSHGLSADETALLGAVFTQLGDTLTTISVAKSNQVNENTGTGEKTGSNENTGGLPSAPTESADIVGDDGNRPVV